MVSTNAALAGVRFLSTRAKDISEATFQQEIMIASREVPIVIDCYANWCEPCQILTPMLEKAVEGSGGRLRLCKINTETEQGLAEALRIKSLPTVFAVYDGQVVDSFVGAPSQEEVQEFVEKVLAVAGDAPDTPETLIEKGMRFLELRDGAAAQTAFSEALKGISELEAGDAPEKAVVVEERKELKAVASAGMIRSSLLLDDLDAARLWMDEVQTNHARFLKLAEVSRGVSEGELRFYPELDVSSLQQAVQQDPDDFDSRLKLCMALMKANSFESAIQECLVIVRKDRSWKENAGQELCLKIFNILGPEHPLTRVYRPKLTNYMFL